MDEQTLARIFDEWLRRFQAEPDAYRVLMDAKPGEYGTNCARFFLQIKAELEAGE